MSYSQVIECPLQIDRFLQEAVREVVRDKVGDRTIVS